MTSALAILFTVVPTGPPAAGPEPTRYGLHEGRGVRRSIAVGAVGAVLLTSSHHWA